MNCCKECIKCLEESLCRHIGQTITIFTTSGGISGAGFTGVLGHVGNGCISLITHLGAAPACPLGSECGFGRERGFERGFEFERGFDRERFGHGRNWLGSVTKIPLCSIASFSHHAI